MNVKLALHTSHVTGADMSSDVVEERERGKWGKELKSERKCQKAKMSGTFYAEQLEFSTWSERVFAAKMSLI